MNFIPRFAVNADDRICRMTINICAENSYRIIAMLEIENIRGKSLREKVCRFSMTVVYYSELSRDA